MDENYTLLGYCVDSYCSWDDGLCVGLKATGDTCTYAFECASEFCANRIPVPVLKIHAVKCLDGSHLALHTRKHDIMCQS